MDWRKRITTNPRVLVGKPVIKGTRLAVEFIVGLLGDGWPIEEVLRNYPGITHEDVQACLAYAAEVLEGEQTHVPELTGATTG
jgi:uncharacterized protein (DUF433 family)